MKAKVFKPLSLSLIVSSMMFLTACGGGGGGNSFALDGEEDKPKAKQPTMTLAKNVDVLNKSEQKKIKKISSTNQNQTNLIVLADSKIASKNIGDIFYSPVEGDNSTGVAVKIVDIKNNSDGTKTIVTKPPELGEVIESYEGNIKEEDKIKPNIVGVIANPGTIVTTKNGKQKLQTGVTKILPTVKHYNSETELSLKLDYALSVPKNKFKKDPIKYAAYKNYCAYPGSYKNKKGGSYKNALDFTDKICDKKLKITGDVTIKLGDIVDTLKLKQKGKKLNFTEGLNQEYALKNNEWSYKLNLELPDKRWDFSKNFPGLSKAYAQNLFKDYEKAELKTFFSRVAITGLNSKDKTGKIPLGGVLFNTFGTVVPVKGSKELEVANQLVSVEGGGVIIFYAVVDINRNIKLTAELAKEPEKFDVGIKYENNKLKMLSNDHKIKTDTNLSLNLKGQLEGKLGAAVEADFFLAGIRFSNIGVSYQGQMNGKIDGKLNWNFTKKVYSGSACVHAGYGKGWLTYGDVALGLEGDVNIGFWKGDVTTGFQYGFMLPSKKDQKDPKYKSFMWNYKNLIGKNNQDWCISTQPPKPEVVSIEHDISKKKQIGKNWYVPTKIKVKNNIKSSIDYWTISYQYGKRVNEISLKQYSDDYLYGGDYLLGNNPKDKDAWILLPYGDYPIDVTATDYGLKQGKTTYQIKLGQAPKIVKVASIETQPKQIVAGEKYKLIIIGKDLPLKKDFNINGCKNQKTLNRYGNKHFYECTAPNIKDGVYSISVKSLDGKKVLLNKKINTLNVSLLPNIVSVADKYIIQILGKQLSPHEDFDVDGCIKKKIIKLMPNKHIYECTAPKKEGMYPITVKSMSDNLNLAVRKLQVTIDRTSQNNTLIWPINCKPGDGCNKWIGYPDIDGDELAVCGGKAGYKGHEGTDINVTWSDMDKGVDVYAAADGVVLWSFDGKYDRCPDDSNGDCYVPKDSGRGIGFPNQSIGGRICTELGNYCNSEFEDGEQCYWCFDGGNVVVIKHDNGTVFATRYDHLRKDSIRVKSGDNVTQGQIIGQVGSSGKSTEPHLHFEVWSDFYKPIDPWKGSCNGRNTSLWKKKVPWK